MTDIPATKSTPAAHATPYPPLTLNARRTAAWFIALAMLCWTLIENMGARFNTPNLNAFQIVWTRYGTHLLFMCIFFLPRRGLGLIKTRMLGMHLLRGLMMLLMLAGYILSRLSFPRYSDTWSAYWVEPMMVVVGGFYLLRENFNLRYLIFAVVGFAGVMLILRPTSDLISPYLVFPFMMAAAYTIYVLLTRRMHDEPIDTKLFYTALCVFTPLTLTIPLFQSISPHDMLILMAMGLVGYLMLLSLELAIDRAPVSYLAPFLFTRVIWGVLADFVLYHHVPGIRTSAGVVLVVVVLYLHYWYSGFHRPKLQEKVAQA